MLKGKKGIRLNKSTTGLNKDGRRRKDKKKELDSDRSWVSKSMGNVKDAQEKKKKSFDFNDDGGGKKWTRF